MANADSPLTILLVEDDPEDARLVTRTLSQVESASGGCEVVHVERLKDAVNRLSASDTRSGIDLALVDLSLPDSGGVDSFNEIHKAAPEVPIIVLSGMNDRETAVQLVQLGAQDFIVKGSMNADLLIRCIRYAIERKRLQQMKDQFISTVSHELRTPLTNMKGIVSNISAGVAGELNPKLKDYLTRVVTNIDRLTHIVNNLLDISNLANGKILLKRSWVDMGGFLRDLAESFEAHVKARGVSLICQSPAGMAMFDMDEGWMRQVMINLIGNAVKFTPRGGKVTIGLAVTDKTGTIWVADTGRGIAPEYHDKVFEPFFQVQAEREAGGGGKGTGLGLAICKEIVEIHGGTIKVESEIGKGSCFTVSLPMGEAKEKHEPTDHPRDRRRGGHSPLPQGQA